MKSGRNNIPARTATRTQPVVSGPADDSMLPKVSVTANRPPGRISVSQVSHPTTRVSQVQIRPAAGIATDDENETNSVTATERAPVEFLPDSEAITADTSAEEPQPASEMADTAAMDPQLAAPTREQKTGSVPVRLAGIEHERKQSASSPEWTPDSVLPLPTSMGVAEVRTIPEEPEFSGPALNGPILRAPDATALSVAAIAEESTDPLDDARHPLAPRPFELSIIPRLTSASRLGLAIGLIGLACAGFWRFTEWRRFRNARRI